MRVGEQGREPIHWGREMGWVGTAWGGCWPGRPELTVKEAGLGSGVAFG